MFDMGFLELAMIGVVALLVFGPDKLPSVARSAGLWIGRAKRFLSSVKTDIDNELRLHELQEQMKQSEIAETLNTLNETRKELNQSVVAPTGQRLTEVKTPPPVVATGDTAPASVLTPPAVQSKPTVTEIASPSTTAPSKPPQP